VPAVEVGARVDVEKRMAHLVCQDLGVSIKFLKMNKRKELEMGRVDVSPEETSGLPNPTGEYVLLREKLLTQQSA